MGRFPAQIERPRSNRVIADSWRGLYGSDPFSSMLPLAAVAVLRNGAICTNISISAVFFSARRAERKAPPEMRIEMRNRHTLSNCNLTGSGADRILKRKRDPEKWIPVLRPIALQISSWRMVLPPALWRIMRRPSKAGIVSVSDEQPTSEQPRPQPPRRLGLGADRPPDTAPAAAPAAAPARSVRQAAAAHHSAGHDRGNADLCARD